ncbi:hypothetical protein EI42_00754 [Thermosporothrix hazakensis]|uniref:Uncharacterized protein n=1 Tax=Thermosporothrix hazakensis TaxID=644383 RepID=A0A326UE60_THEHA|nr:hypothetical protein EI42_00754 [Thermosporothrix hazakensis]
MLLLDACQTTQRFRLKEKEQLACTLLIGQAETQRWQPVIHNQTRLETRKGMIQPKRDNLLNKEPRYIVEEFAFRRHTYCKQRFRQMPLNHASKRSGSRS